MPNATHTKKLSGIPPGRCIHTEKENAMSNLSRRSIVASAAALPALAVPVIGAGSTELDRMFGSEPDPIFAAIEAFEDARDAHAKAFHNDDEAASQGPLLAAYSDALERLLNTEPTTVVGMAAALVYVRDNMEHGGPIQDGDDIEDFIDTMARSAAALAGFI
jgi:hypothetical protein